MPKPAIKRKAQNTLQKSPRSPSKKRVRFANNAKLVTCNEFGHTLPSFINQYANDSSLITIIQIEKNIITQQIRSNGKDNESLHEFYKSFGTRKRIYPDIGKLKIKVSSRNKMVKITDMKSKLNVQIKSCTENLEQIDDKLDYGDFDNEEQLRADYLCVQKKLKSFVSDESKLSSYKNSLKKKTQKDLLSTENCPDNNLLYIMITSPNLICSKEFARDPTMPNVNAKEVHQYKTLETFMCFE
jgi:hypothetical protein